jgi:nucleoside-diphosphate-sugar epimerase
MYAVGAGMELAAWALRPVVRTVPPVTRFSVLMITRDFTYCGARAREELGYQPVYTADEALARTVRYFREHGPVKRV